jgi:hypothetical protein
MQCGGKIRFASDFPPGEHRWSPAPSHIATTPRINCLKNARPFPKFQTKRKMVEPGTRLAPFRTWKRVFASKKCSFFRHVARNLSFSLLVSRTNCSSRRLQERYCRDRSGESAAGYGPGTSCRAPRVSFASAYHDSAHCSSRARGKFRRRKIMLTRLPRRCDGHLFDYFCPRNRFPARSKPNGSSPRLQPMELLL